MKQLVLLLALTSGCRHEAANRASTGTDSAGASITIHAAAALSTTPVWTLDSAAAISLGAGQGDPDLQWVFEAVILPDGRIAALSHIPPKVLIFGADGRLQRTIGRLGKGPADFTRVQGLLLVGRDSLYVPDDANARINWLSPEGFLGAQPMESPGMASCEEPRGLLRDRRIVTINGCSRGIDSGRAPVAVRVSRLDRSGGSVVKMVPGQMVVPVATRFRGQARTYKLPLRLGPTSLATAWDSLVVVGTNEGGYRIDLLAPDGRLLSAVQVQKPRRAVTAAMREKLIDAELERMSGPASEGMVDPNESRRLAREAPFADSLPYYTQFIVSADGTLWVVDAIAPGDPGWTATGFRGDGSIVARLVSPAPSIPLYIEPARVLARRTDEDGVTSLAIYPIRR